MMFFLSAISVICPEYITTISSHPYEIHWGNIRIDFSHPLSIQESYGSFETEIQYCSANAHSKLKEFAMLQDSIIGEHQKISRRKTRKYKKYPPPCPRRHVGVSKGLFSGLLMSFK